MDAFIGIILGLHASVWIGLFVLLIFLVFRRIKLKDKENFEQRDN